MDVSSVSVSSFVTVYQLQERLCVGATGMFVCGCYRIFPVYVLQECFCARAIEMWCVYVGAVGLLIA